MTTQPKPRSLFVKLVLGLFTIVALCCGVSAISVIFSSRSSQPARPTGQPANITVHIVATPAPLQATVSAAATAAPAAATDTPVPPPTEAPPPTAVPAPAGSSRDNPAPIGAPFAAKEFSVVVHQVVRPADRIVAAGNMFNAEPEAGEEYVKVVVSVTCTADSKSKCSVSPFDFKMYGTQGIVRDAKWMIAGVDGQLESTELLGGATLENKALFFLVGADETGVVMEFEAGFLFRESAFFAIPDEAPEP
jgi:hypothetical protein